MSKKTLLTILGAVFAIAVYWLGFANGVYYSENKTEDIEILSDEELVSLRIESEWGPGYYGVIYGTNDDDFIDYEVYSENGELAYICTTNRNYMIKTHLGIH